MNRRILIGLLCNNLYPVDIYEKLSHNAIDLVIFTQAGIDWKRRTIKGLVFENGKWINKTTRFPDAVYNRLYTCYTTAARNLELILGHGKVFNGFTRFNKLKIYNILIQTKLKYFMIPTYLYSSKRLLVMLKNHGRALIKPVVGSTGSNVFMVTSENKKYRIYSKTFLSYKEFSSTAELLYFLKKLNITGSYIIQPFISFMPAHGHKFDMRFIVQKNRRGIWEVTADMCRVCYKSSFVSNIVYSVKPVYSILESIGYEKVYDHLKKISIKTAKKLEKKLYNLGEISVDFGIDEDNKLWIIEINGKPDKSALEPINDKMYKKAMLTPIEYAGYLAFRNN